jgi:hypothetical protein
VKGKNLPGVGVTRVEGEILGVESVEGEPAKVALRLLSGERILIPLDGIQKAHLVYRWD